MPTEICNQYYRYCPSGRDFISGFNIYDRIGLPTIFVKCDIHPECIEAINEFTVESGWQFKDCRSAGHDLALYMYGQGYEIMDLKIYPTQTAH